jgi:biopolymer transport protein ExbB/TolQ
MARRLPLALGASVATIVAAIVAVLFHLGVLPWATRAEVLDFRRTLEQRAERIERQVDEIHKLFFPGRPP